MKEEIDRQTDRQTDRGVFLQKVQFKHFCLPKKASCLPTENNSETPAFVPKL